MWANSAGSVAVGLNTALVVAGSSRYAHGPTRASTVIASVISELGNNKDGSIIVFALELHSV
jgi:hypothetical protein